MADAVADPERPWRPQTAAEQRIRRVVDRFEEQMFESISTGAAGDGLSDTEVVAALTRFGETDLAEKYQNWAEE